MISDFCPSLWQEVPTPNFLETCEDCGLYKHGSRMIWGEGNSNAAIMVLLDNPGERETKEGQSYVCGTRQTLQEAAHYVGLSEKDLYITYILKRKPKRAYDKEQARRICMQHLKVQLQDTQPTLVICLGNVAVQSFFENPDVDVKGLRGKFYNIHGYKTTVAYHPLAIRRRPNLRSLFIEDWQLLAQQYHSFFP